MKKQRLAFKWINAADEAIDSLGAFNSFIDNLVPVDVLANAEADPVTEPVVVDEPVDETVLDTATQTQTQTQTTSVSTQQDEGPKDNGAFARMRIQNKQQQQVMTRLLQRLGVDASYADNIDQITQLLDEADVETDAERMKIPAEVLNRLQYLERQNARSEQERNYQTTLLGFTNLQNELGLEQKDITAFAAQLAQEGVDPFTGQLDLKKEFIARNYQTLVQKEVEKAVQAALAKDAKAAQHSTVPATKQGKQATGIPTDKINTQAKLDKLLLDLSK